MSHAGNQLNFKQITSALEIQNMSRIPCHWKECSIKEVKLCFLNGGVIFLFHLLKA